MGLTSPICFSFHSESAMLQGSSSWFGRHWQAGRCKSRVPWIDPAFLERGPSLTSQLSLGDWQVLPPSYPQEGWKVMLKAPERWEMCMWGTLHRGTDPYFTLHPSSTPGEGQIVWPSEKLNLILSRESTPTKDEAPQLMRLAIPVKLRATNQITRCTTPFLISFLALMSKEVTKIGW